MCGRASEPAALTPITARNGASSRPSTGSGVGGAACRDGLAGGAAIPDRRGAVTRRHLAPREPWVIAVRPGFVDSPSLRKVAALDPHNYPISPAIRDGIDNGETLGPDEAGRQIWAALPPAGDESVLLFGAPPSGVDAKGAPRQAGG
jgi:hypothetical protein